jgi:hypothetical protein
MMQDANYESQSLRRDDGVTFIAVYHFLVAAMFLVGTVVLALPTMILAVVAVFEAPPAAIGMFAVGLGAIVTFLFCALYLAVGYGLWKLRQWARISAMALALISLLFFPVGTAIGAVVLWHLAKPEVAQQFEHQG